MIALDLYIVEFISGNYLTITIFLTLLKGWAKISKNTADDAVSTLLSNLWVTLKPVRKEKEI